MADGRVGEAALVLPAETWTLTDVRTETVVGDLRVDVSAVHDGVPVFIEVAVTHCVDDAKQRLLSALGIPCFEIALDALAEEEWTWDTLAAAVLHDPGNRNWLFHPELARLEADARQRAIEKALASQTQRLQEPDRIKLRLFGTAISVIDRGWGLCLWSRYDDKVNPIIKSVAQSFGGRWNPKYKNWVIPAGAKAALLAMLEEIGAERLLNGNGQ